MRIRARIEGRWLSGRSRGLAVEAVSKECHCEFCRARWKLLTDAEGAEGNETWTLTPMGEQVANQMAMSSEDDAAESRRG